MYQNEQSTRYVPYETKIFHSFGELLSSTAVPVSVQDLLREMMAPNQIYRVHTLEKQDTRKPYVTPTLTQLTKEQANALIERAEKSQKKN